MELQIKLPTDLRAPASARRALGALDGFVEEPVRDRLELLVSEVVTNSVRHSGQPDRASILLDIRRHPGGVSVRVSDPGPGFAPQTVPEPSLRAGRWGLYLVDRLADRWGVETNDHTTVWFEVRAQD